MTVFLSYAPADQAAAEALEKFVERRGHFVEMDDGEIALRPIEPSDVVVLLISSAFLDAASRLRHEQRALDAWADARLLIVKLDAAAAPVGLRDLDMLDARDEAKREALWPQVLSAILEHRQNAPAPALDEETRAPEAEARTRGRLWWAPILGLAPGMLALAASVSIWLVNRIGPTPGGWPELRAGIDALGARYGIAPVVTEAGFALAIGLMLICAVLLILPLLRRGPRAATAAPLPVASDAVFVACAKADAAAVAPALEAARESGPHLKLSASVRGVADTVRAIRAASSVVVICSKAAFESDHIKRQVYLADRYGKRIAPVFIEAVALPRDFEYFFAGVQSLSLFETPEAERPAALAQALGAAA